MSLLLFPPRRHPHPPPPGHVLLRPPVGHDPLGPPPPDVLLPPALLGRGRGRRIGSPSWGRGSRRPALLPPLPPPLSPPRGPGGGRRGRARPPPPLGRGRGRRRQGVPLKGRSSPPFLFPRGMGVLERRRGRRANGRPLSPPPLPLLWGRPVVVVVLLPPPRRPERPPKRRRAAAAPVEVGRRPRALDPGHPPAGDGAPHSVDEGAVADLLLDVLANVCKVKKMMFEECLARLISANLLLSHSPRITSVLSFSKKKEAYSSFLSGSFFPCWQRAQIMSIRALWL